MPSLVVCKQNPQCITQSMHNRHDTSQIPLYLLDSAMLVTLVVQLGVSYAKELDIARNFVFITNSALAGLSMVSWHCCLRRYAGLSTCVG